MVTARKTLKGEIADEYILTVDTIRKTGEKISTKKITKAHTNKTPPYFVMSN